MLKNNIYSGIATHDTFLIEKAIKLIQNYSVLDNMYEFQMLYGVAPNLRERIVSEGHKIRVYVPYGKQWFGYCSRRLKENPKMVWDITKAIFVRG
jgi:proline dehydrogenase